MASFLKFTSIAMLILSYITSVVADNAGGINLIGLQSVADIDGGNVDTSKQGTLTELQESKQKRDNEFKTFFFILLSGSSIIIVYFLFFDEDLEIPKAIVVEENTLDNEGNVIAQHATSFIRNDENLNLQTDEIPKDEEFQTDEIPKNAEAEDNQI